jgi:histidinol dehydrogenase
VDKITGPGNAYVAAAKRRVFGRVGIDMIAGPSEILVIADRDNDPDWIALDLLSQAEHDESAQSILITMMPAFGGRWRRRSRRGWKLWPRAAIAGASWRDYGAIITVRDLDEAARLSNRVAPNIWNSAWPTPRAGPSDHPCRGDFPGRMDARGDRRLCRRAEPCAAHRTLGAVFHRACRCWISSNAPRLRR